jgi:uncharacterized protein (TIGR02569 family)
MMPPFEADTDSIAGAMCTIRNMPDPPAGAVLGAFGVSDTPSPLDGGEGQSWSCGALVLKPCADPVEWAWLGHQLPSVVQDGFRLALPVRASDGRWVVEGWCAQPLLEGSHPGDGRWLDVLAVGERFHRATADLKRPEFIDARTDPSSVGDRVAWDEAESPVAHSFLGRLLDLRRPVHLAAQVIHGDLTENVLFADPLKPAVIDVTPYWRPAGFAAAVVVADAICWWDADPDELVVATSTVAGFPQFLVRAAIYRLVTSLVFGQSDLDAYARVVGLAEQLATVDAA